MNVRVTIPFEEEFKLELEDNREFLPQECVEDREQVKILMQAFEDLPEHYREALVARFYSNLSYTEIAYAMDLTEKQVDNILARGKKRLYEVLEKRHGKAFRSARILSVLPIPVLTQAFQVDADSIITNEMMNRVTQGVMASIHGGAAGAKTAGAVAKAKSAGVLPKVVGVLVTTAVVTAGVTYILNRPEPVKERPPVIAEEPVSTSTEAKAETPDSMPEESQTLSPEVIETLADLIGSEKEAMLMEYVSHGVSPELWGQFLTEINAGTLSENLVYEEAYHVYQVQKQDKQLILIDKVGTDGNIQVKYRFADAQETVPEGMMVYFSYQEW